MFEIFSPLAFQHFFENEERKVIPRPHGNSKKGKVFPRTKPKQIVHASVQGKIGERK